MNDEVQSMIRTVTLCVLAVLGFAALCLTLFFKNYADPTVLVAIIGTTGTVIGFISGRRQSSPAASETTTKENEV